MNNIPNLCEWRRGDVICASRLNKMVSRINEISAGDSYTSSSLRTNLTGNGLNTYGSFKHQICRMHDENGHAKVVDTFVASSTASPCFIPGAYSRNNSAISFSNNPCLVEDDCFKLISCCIGEKKFIYQKITTDRFGVATNIEMVAFCCENKPSSTPWDYTASSDSCGNGVIYNPVLKS